jgi:hypothetical protein
MNPTQLERLLLLEQSRELSAPQRAALEAELAASPDARRLRDDLRRLAASLPPPTREPSADAAQRIADRLARPAPRRSAFAPAWASALAAAAALALLLGVRALRTPSSPQPSPLLAQSAPADSDAASDEWQDPYEDDFAELENLMLAISEFELDFTEL